jgi:hypothetical protein
MLVRQGQLTIQLLEEKGDSAWKYLAMAKEMAEYLAALT